MRQPLLLELSGVGIHRSNLLKLGMEIYPSFENVKSGEGSSGRCSEWFEGDP